MKDVSLAFTTVQPITPNVFLVTLPITRQQFWIAVCRNVDLLAHLNKDGIGHLCHVLNANLIRFLMS